MSKIIDALLKTTHPVGPESEQGRKATAAVLSETVTASSQAKNLHPKTRMIAEQLAGVYFKGEQQSSAPRSGEQQTQPALPAPPTIIQITETGRSFMGPWLVTTAVLILLMALLFVDKRLAVTVHLSDRNSATLAAPLAAAVAGPVRLESAAPKPGTDTKLPEALFIPASKFEFFAAASLHSSKDRATLNIANSSLSSIAYAALDFEKPFQAASYDLYFEVRGEKGVEKTELILKDANGNSSLGWRSLLYFPNEPLTTEWRPVRLSFEPSLPFDLNQLAQIRFEVGTQRTGNPPNARVQIRNIQFLPRSGD